MQKKYHILGLSKFGSGLAQILAESGNDVVVIDKNKASFLKLSPNFPGYRIEGDLTDIQFLESSGLVDSENVVIATDSDNLNIMLTHICYKIFNVSRIFVRLSRNDKELLFKNMKGVSVINPYQLSLNYFLSITGEKK